MPVQVMLKKTLSVLKQAVKMMMIQMTLIRVINKVLLNFNIRFHLFDLYFILEVDSFGSPSMK